MTAAPLPLPAGITSRVIGDVNGLNMHVLEAGNAANPTVLLLHGFPELAYSWRKVMLPIAEAGYHVVAPDQRGYGRTAGWSDQYDADLTPFIFANLVKDALALVYSLGKEKVHAVVGHDFGSPAAGWCALIRPDVFRRVVLMSAPFAGAPAIQTKANTLIADLLKLTPPRTPYRHYYSMPQANDDMLYCPEGVFEFLRAYYHVKSADHLDNQPFPLTEITAREFAKLPTYYVMQSGKTMPQTVRPYLPDAAPAWLSDDELGVYASEYERTGFQGGLNWYRSSTSTAFFDRMSLFANRTIDVPAWFIAGQSDWGRQQTPGAFDKMTSRVCTDYRGTHIVEGAGHWVQQEQPEAVLAALLPALSAH